MPTTRLHGRIHAPARRVFQALVDADAVRLWMAPEEMAVRVHRFEPREGGAIRISLGRPPGSGAGKTGDGTDTYQGRFVEVVPGKRVVQRIEFETDDPSLRGPMTITYLLTESGEETVLHAVHDDLPPGLSPVDNEAGWRRSLARLKALVETSSDAKESP